MEEVEGDADDCVSLSGCSVSELSSTMGSVAGAQDLVIDEHGPENCENVDLLPTLGIEIQGEERDSAIDEVMKRKLGNIKKKGMSSIIMNDLLGADGEATVKDIKKSHMKLLRRNQLRVNEIHRSVLYFQEKFNIRRERLKTNLSKSINNQYERRSYSWQDKYDAIMNEIRKE